MTPKQNRSYVLKRYPGTKCRYACMGFVIRTKTNIILCDGRYSRSMAWSVAAMNARFRREGILKTQKDDQFLYD